MTSTKFLSRLLSLAIVGAGLQYTAHADTTFTGTFANDSTTFEYDFTAAASSTYNFFTTSYGGGANVNGTTTKAGGFVPVLTLFQANGTVIGPSVTGGAIDPTTKIADDAFLTQVLGPGSYILILSEFPNVALGNLPDGFLFAGQANATSLVCNGGGTGTFLEADLTPCVQRANNYALNVSTAASPSAVPEPATWLLVLPSAGLFLALGRKLYA